MIGVWAFETVTVSAVSGGVGGREDAPNFNPSNMTGMLLPKQTFDNELGQRNSAYPRAAGQKTFHSARLSGSFPIT